MIEQVCQEHQARLVVVGRDWRSEPGSFSLDGQSFSVCGETYWLPLIGGHQVINAVIAKAAVIGFSERTGLKVAPEAIKAGLAKVIWLGRWKCLAVNPPW